MPKFSRRLKVNQGSTRPWEFVVRDSDSQDIDVSSVTDAAFVVKDRIGGTEVISFSITGGDMTKDTSSHAFTVFSCVVTQGEADGLTPGTYLGQLEILWTPDNWRKGDIIEVEVVGEL